MPLPAFSSHGDLPEGVYKASLDEVVARFGHGTPQRQLVTTRLRHIYALAHATGNCSASSSSAVMSRRSWSQLTWISSSWSETIFENRIMILRCAQCLITDVHNGNLAPVFSSFVQRFSLEKQWTISSRTGRSHAIRAVAALSKSLWRKEYDCERSRTPRHTRTDCLLLSSTGTDARHRENAGRISLILRQLSR